MQFPEQMIAIEIDDSVLKPVQRAIPTPSANQVLIKVEAAGVNRPDVMQRKGLYPPPPGVSDIPGLEVAGTIQTLGDNINHLNIGDRVCALVIGGGYAEYCLASAAHCLP
ncbi:MAG: alcohol dehydrogenase catalytic domain-containing protein, partial [Methylobacter sp.]